MSKDERTIWLFGAFEHLEEHQIPHGPFCKAAFIARDTCDHPAKIVPTIIRESKDWADNIRKVVSIPQVTKTPYENRLRGPVERDCHPQSVDEKTKKILDELKERAARKL